MKVSGLLVALPLLLGACGSPGSGTASQSSPTPEVPQTLEVICYEDGSTEVVNDEVRASADGVHIRVDNRAGEFVSLNGTGLDFGEGTKEQAARTPPGRIEVACWPGSKHRGPEPPTTPVRIVDPDGVWTESKLECPPGDMMGDAILDYGSASEGEQGEPEELARENLRGLNENDEIVTLGYPEAQFRSVGVVREGKTVAVVSFSPTEDGGWQIGGYSNCDSSRIRM
jgi:hypothetical protein